MTPDEQYGAVLDAVHRFDGEYVVAVPSYQRSDLIADRTLATLERLKVDRERVTVFVADDTEAEAYAAAIPSWRVVVARPGLVECRRWYTTSHYAASTRILSLDDDIDELLARTPDAKLEPWAGTVDELAAMGFGISDALGLGLWGINGYANGMYMHDEAVVGLRYICGIAFGHYAGDPDEAEADSGEDFLRTLRAFDARGAVARLDWLGPKTRYFGAGGMLATFADRAARDRAHASRLRAIAIRYPGLAKVYVKADGTTNLRLRDLTSLRVSRPALEAAV